MSDLDLAAYLINVDASADELLAALDTLCNGIDESLYNGRTNLLVFENDSREDQDDIEGTRSATAL